MDNSITLLLTLAQQGDRRAENQVFHLIYGKLHGIARSLMFQERPGHTLQPTALVSEAFLKKLRRISTPIRNRDHYYSLVAYSMRQVLIDHARANRSAKRRVPPEMIADLLIPLEEPFANTEERLAAQQGLRKLAELDPGAAECIRLRFIVGLTVKEIAERLHRPVWKVRAECDFGLNWMAGRLAAPR